MSEHAKLNFIKDGPISLKGEVEIVDSDGKTIRTQGSTSFCRCGKSQSKPFCYGSHVGAEFQAPADLGASS